MESQIICLEGIIGAGKSTQLEKLFSFLKPNATILPEFNQFSPLKDIIQEWKKRAYASKEICFSKDEIKKLAKARAMVQRNLLEFLPNKPSYILGNRSVYTAIVFETGELSIDEIEDINRGAGVIFPDCGFVLDCESVEALKRIDKRRKEQKEYIDRSIHETIEEIQKRRELYLSLIDRHPELKLIDTNKSKIEVFENIQKYFQNGYR